MFKCAVLTVLLVLAAGVATAQNTPTISFVNYSGESATIKLIGPTGGYHRSAPRRVEDGRCPRRRVQYRHAVRYARQLLVSAWRPVRRFRKRLQRGTNLDHASQSSQRQLPHGAGKTVGF